MCMVKRQSKKRKEVTVLHVLYDYTPPDSRANGCSGMVVSYLATTMMLLRLAILIPELSHKTKD